MSIFGSGIQGLTSKLIALAGQPLTFIKRSQSGTYNPATGMTIATASYAVNGTIAPYETFRHMGFRKDDGLDVVQGDLYAIVSAAAVDGTAIPAPQTNDQIANASTTYSVNSVAPHSPSGVPLFYLCSLRGAQ